MKKLYSIMHSESVSLTLSSVCLGFVFKAVDENRDEIVAVKRTQKAGKIASRE